MQNPHGDDELEELTAEELICIAKEASRKAVQETFDAGLNITIFEDGFLKVINKHGEVVEQRRVPTSKEEYDEYFSKR